MRHLSEDERYTINPKRVENRKTLIATLSEKYVDQFDM